MHDAVIIGGGPAGLRAALAGSLRAWRDDVVLISDDPADARAAHLAGRVARFVGRSGVLERIDLEDGRSLARRAVFLTLEQRQGSDLARELGLTVDDEHGVPHGPHGAAGVPDLDVAGDASCDTSLAIVAAAEGATAMAIHEASTRPRPADPSGMPRQTCP